MPRKKNPHSKYVKPDYHSQNKAKQKEDESMNNQKKIKLRSSLDIYNRLIHDKTLNIDLNNVIIGYRDNILGDQEVPILKWTMIDDGGDIPMHLIFDFTLILDDGKRIKIWDRKTKLDRLYCSGITNKQQSLKSILHSPQNKSFQSQPKPSKTNNTSLWNEQKQNDTKNVQKFKYLVVLDFEATCDQNKDFSPQEIIEWPAMIIDTATFKILDCNSNIFHYYIKPKYNPQLTPFCTQLTGITQSLIDTKGTSNTIQSVVNNWNQWCFDNDLLPKSETKPNAAIITCGDWDLKRMWSTQHRVTKCRNPVLFHSWINIKTIFKQNMNKFGENKRNTMRGSGMMAMLNYLNIKHEGRHHSGIDDVKNICKIVQKLLMNNVYFDYTTKHFGNRSIWNDINVKASKSILLHQKQNNNDNNNDNDDEQKISHNLISEMIEEINDCILTVQSSLDKTIENDDNLEQKDIDINTTICIGTKCILYNLENMASMNGKLCKIIDKYNDKEQRYPVYVYETKDTVLIKPCNLKIVRNKRIESKKEINVIYDMETGDPDDLFAILFLISHPRVNLRAITITPGTLSQVGAIKNLLFNKLKLKPNSISIGSANPNHQKRCIPNGGTWVRVCGPIKEQQPDGAGCDIIHQTITKYEDCMIVTGAPLTNLYNYVIKYCNMDILNESNKKKLTWICQGGFAGDNVVSKEYRLPKFDGKQFVPTWNFNGNIKASEYLLIDKHCNNVFDKRYLVSKNVCHGVYYNDTFHSKMKEFKDKHQALRIIYDEMSTYMNKRKDGKKFHDVLAAVAAVNRNAVKFEEIVPCLQKHGKHGFEWGSKLSSDSNIFISVKHNKTQFFETFIGLH